MPQIEISTNQFSQLRKHARQAGMDTKSYIEKQLGTKDIIVLGKGKAKDQPNSERRLPNRHTRKTSPSHKSRFRGRRVFKEENTIVAISNIKPFLPKESVPLVDEKSEPAKEETLLLEQITIGFQDEFWERYNFLQNKLKQSTLTAEEHEDLISLSDQIEEKNATRISLLSELSKLKKMDLEELMNQLGIIPQGHG